MPYRELRVEEAEGVAYSAEAFYMCVRPLDHGGMIWVEAGVRRICYLRFAGGSDNNCVMTAGVRRHPYQNALDQLARYVVDACRLQFVIQERIGRNTQERRRSGGHGRGAPDIYHKTLNRAVAVAAVGAWEAFNEHLATAAALEKYGTWREYLDWYPISGKSGQIQTPSSRNVRRLYWSLFQFDPLPHWRVDVTASPWEISGTGSHWRVSSVTYSGREASTFLDGVVSIRHGFAHQDVLGVSGSGTTTRPLPGLAVPGRDGKWNVNSHHAENAISCVLQLAIITATELGRFLSVPQKLRWTEAMNRAEWSQFLTSTPALALVKSDWLGAPNF